MNAFFFLGFFFLFGVVNVHGTAQILPCLFFARRRTQQIGRMVGDDQRNFAATVTEKVFPVSERSERYIAAGI